MNERIRQLVRQAGLDDADFPIENWDNVPLAKFAELIVRECVQAVKNVGGYNEEYHMNAIKKYFGVEE